MKVELFTLCEGAFNTNGRLTIVNTFENIVSNQYPWRGQLGIALKLLFLKEEVGEYDITVSIQPSYEEQKIHEMKAHLSMQTGEKANDVHVAMASNIQGLLISKPGDYKVVIDVNGAELYSCPFKALN